MEAIACICVHHEPESMLKACLSQFPEWVGKIVVMVSEEPWHGIRDEHAMETMRFLTQHPDPRLEVWRMNWRTESEQRNWGMGRAADADWALIFDVDEFLTVEDWAKLRSLLKETARKVPCVVASDMLTYWKDMDHVWEPKDAHKPIIAANPARAAFFDKRCISEQSMFEAKVTLHHLSWVKTDEEVRRKISHWSHANDFDRDEWYDRAWKGWKPEMAGLRPYGSEASTKAVISPIPDSIRSLFKG